MTWIQSAGNTFGSTTGSGEFIKAGRRSFVSRAGDVVLGDLDGDGDLDAVSLGSVALNDGSGQFTDSGQNLGYWVGGISLGDVDNDGDLDVFFARRHQQNELWLNDGSGTFTNSGQKFNESGRSADAAMADLDGDGDLDIFVGNYWRNNYRYKYEYRSAHANRGLASTTATASSPIAARDWAVPIPWASRSATWTVTATRMR